jgi:hypothetical protein
LNVGLRAIGRPIAVSVGVLAAALLIGYGLSVGASPDHPYLLASLISALPVAGVAVSVAKRWPRAGALGLLGMITFGGAFIEEATSKSGRPEPLALAIACVLIVGVILVLAHRARWRDVLAGLLLAYASVAFMFYFSVLF